MYLTIEAESPAELREKVCALAACFAGEPAGAPSEALVASEQEATEAAPVASEPAPAKRGRKPKAAKEATKPTESVSETESAEPATDPFPTPAPASAAQEVATSATSPRETAVNALSALIETKGVAVAREVLKAFQCSRVSEVKEEDCAKFAAACEAAKKKAA